MGARGAKHHWRSPHRHRRPTYSLLESSKALPKCQDTCQRSTLSRCASNSVVSLHVGGSVPASLCRPRYAGTLCHRDVLHRRKARMTACRMILGPRMLRSWKRCVPRLASKHTRAVSLIPPVISRLRP